MKSKVYTLYYHTLSSIRSIPEEDVAMYAAEFTERQRRGWRIPTNTYLRCRDILYYKPSLERTSPYYTDLLKIEDVENLKTVLLDLYSTIRINPYKLRRDPNLYDEL